MDSVDLVVFEPAKLNSIVPTHVESVGVRFFSTLTIWAPTEVAKAIRTIESNRRSGLYGFIVLSIQNVFPILNEKRKMKNEKFYWQLQTAFH